VYFPDRKVDSSNFDKDDVELMTELVQEVVNLADDVGFHRIHGDLRVNFFVKPFNDGVLHLTDALEISEILLKSVPIRRKVADSIVVPYVVLPGQRLHQRLEPDDTLGLDHTHQGH